MLHCKLHYFVKIFSVWHSMFASIIAHLHRAYLNSLHLLHILFIASLCIVCSFHSIKSSVFSEFICMNQWVLFNLCKIAYQNVNPFEIAIKQIELYKRISESFNEVKKYTLPNPQQFLLHPNLFTSIHFHFNGNDHSGRK